MFLHCCRHRHCADHQDTHRYLRCIDRESTNCTRLRRPRTPRRARTLRRPRAEVVHLDVAIDLRHRHRSILFLKHDRAANHSLKMSISTVRESSPAIRNRRFEEMITTITKYNSCTSSLWHVQCVVLCRSLSVRRSILWCTCQCFLAFLKQTELTRTRYPALGVSVFLFLFVFIWMCLYITASCFRLAEIDQKVI